MHLFCECVILHNNLVFSSVYKDQSNTFQNSTFSKLDDRRATWIKTQTGKMNN